MGVIYDGWRYDIDPGEFGDFGQRRADWLNRYRVGPASKLKRTRNGYIVDNATKTGDQP